MDTVGNNSTAQQTQIKVLDLGFVEYIDDCGENPEKRIACSARVSYANDLTATTAASDSSLIRYLIKKSSCVAS